MSLFVERQFTKCGPARVERGLRWFLGPIGVGDNRGWETIGVGSGACLRAQRSDGEVQQHCLSHHWFEIDLILGERVGFAVDRDLFEDLLHHYVGAAHLLVEAPATGPNPLDTDRAAGHKLFAERTRA